MNAFPKTGIQYGSHPPFQGIVRGEKQRNRKRNQNRANTSASGPCQPACHGATAANISSYSRGLAIMASSPFGSTCPPSGRRKAQVTSRKKEKRPSLTGCGEEKGERDQSPARQASAAGNHATLLLPPSSIFCTRFAETSGL